MSYEEQLVYLQVALSALATCRRQILALPVLEGATPVPTFDTIRWLDRLVLMHEGEIAVITRKMTEAP